MRGKPETSEMTFDQVRNTPAYAGKLISELLVGAGKGNTPAYAGKTASHRQHPDSRAGTPPRMRRKHALCLLIFLDNRNTPAYAGKT